MTTLTVVRQLSGYEVYAATGASSDIFTRIVTASAAATEFTLAPGDWLIVSPNEYVS
jgi:hypothetical protein